MARKLSYSARQRRVANIHGALHLIAIALIAAAFAYVCHDIDQHRSLEHIEGGN